MLDGVPAIWLVPFFPQFCYLYNSKSRVQLQHLTLNIVFCTLKIVSKCRFVDKKHTFFSFFFKSTPICSEHLCKNHTFLLFLDKDSSFRGKNAMIYTIGDVPMNLLDIINKAKAEKATSLDLTFPKKN